MAFALTGSKAGWFCRSRFKEVFALKHLMRFNLVLGLWLIVSPFVLVLLNPRVFRLLWEDFILGLGIATFSLCRLSSRRVAALADGLVGALGLITLINPILYHYFNVKVAAWNNLAVGSVVFILAIYQDRIDSESSR
jgi:SPW repeat